MNTVKHILTCAGLTLLVSSCASNLAPSSGSSQSVSSSRASANSEERGIAERVYSLVNAKRASAGKRSLTGHSALNVIAQQQCQKMANGHVESGYAAKGSRSQYAYLKHNIENMNELTYKVPAGVSDPAGRAVGAWTHVHEGERSHVLQAWHVVGVGVKRTPSNTYITMCLGARPSGVPRSVSPIGW
ncbi:MAG: CAP domain-containing protein [Akkermansiaceae bacterium]